MAAAAGGLRSSASAQPKTVRGSPRSWKIRITRQKPTRLPYSNMPSAARSRPVTPGFVVAPDSVPARSEKPSPSGTEGSEPSS